MCLSIAVDSPGLVLGRGVHAGYQWLVLANPHGHRCGYARVPKGHPWHGRDWDGVEGASVHGGLTFAEADVSCGAGEDDAWWLGFDFAHAFDLPDPALPSCVPMGLRREPAGLEDSRWGWHTWTQEEAEAECRRLCEQAAAAGAQREDNPSPPPGRGRPYYARGIGIPAADPT